MSAGNTRGFGPGPVFVYEWITSSGRWQGCAWQSLFVLGLMAALLVMGISRGAEVIVATTSVLRAPAQFGEGFFVAVIGTQLTLVLLATPAATAGAICLDRSRGTLTHLLVTDLTDREIVLGKLAARLTPILALVAATLPVMELLTLLGGVDPDALLGAFLVTLGVAVLGCTLALVFSLRVRRTHEALLATYAVWGVWLLSTTMLDEINRITGASLVIPPRTTNPYLLAVAPYWQPRSVDWHDYAGFLAVTWGISAILALHAVLSMRRVCTRDVERRAARRPAAGVAIPAKGATRLMMGSPWFWSGMMTALVRPGNPQDVWTPAYYWTLAYALTALLLPAATLSTFNRCVGRVESRSSLEGRRGAEKKKEAPAGLSAW